MPKAIAKTEPAEVRGTSFPQSAFRVLGHTVAPPELPDFGEPIFTPEYQAEHPTERCTRLVKDVLHIGRWLVGYSYADDDSEENTTKTPIWWDVDENRLRTICQNNRLAQSRGFAVNLIKSHGDPFTGLVHPNDIVCPVHAWRIHGDAMWIEVYVTPEEARQLQNPAWKVSVKCRQNYQAGDGQTYSEICLHVAIVDLPVIDSQGPFVQCALPSAADNSGARAPEQPKARGSSMDFASLLEALNNVLMACGQNALPDDTTELNLVDRLVMLGSMLGSDPETPDPSATDSEAFQSAADAATTASQHEVQLSAEGQNLLGQVRTLLAPVLASVKGMQDTVSRIVANSSKGAIAEGEVLLSQAAQRGIAPVTIEAARKAWKKAGHDMAMLEFLRDPGTNVTAGNAGSTYGRRTPVPKPPEKKPTKVVPVRKARSAVIRAFGGNPDRVPAHIQDLVFDSADEE